MKKNKIGRNGRALDWEKMKTTGEAKKGTAKQDDEKRRRFEAWKDQRRNLM